MNDEQKAIAEHVRNKRSAVRKAEQAAEKATKALEKQRAELRGCEEMARAVGVTVEDEQAGPESAAAQKRGLSEKWKAVIGAMAARYPQGLSLDEIGALAQAQGLSSATDTIRSQMHSYMGRYVLRIATGTYRATEEGARAAGTSLGNGGGVKNGTAGVDETPAAA